VFYILREREREREREKERERERERERENLDVLYLRIFNDVSFFGKNRKSSLQSRMHRLVSYNNNDKPFVRKMVAYSLLAGLDHAKLDLDPLRWTSRLSICKQSANVLLIPLCVYLTVL